MDIDTVTANERKRVLYELRQMWCCELAQGRPVFAIPLEAWATFCKNAGITEDWWELK